MTEQELADWLAQHSRHLDTAKTTLHQAVSDFLDDYAGDYEFRVDEEPYSRVKSVSRSLEKCIRKDVADAEAAFIGPIAAVGDLVGARVVVRSLNDLRELQRAFVENFELSDLRVDDKVDAPTATGYRAVHLNGALEVTRHGVAISVPFEIQLKTLLEDRWGTLTHSDAYSRTDINTDVRFSQIRELQRVLAEQLHVADLLLLSIEDLSEDAVHMIALEPPGEEMTLANVVNLMYARYGEYVRLPEGQRLLDAARDAGLQSIQEMGKLLDQREESAEEIGDRFRVQNGRTPKPLELWLAYLSFADL